MYSETSTYIGISKKILMEKCQAALFVVTGEKSAQIVDGLPQGIIKKSILINLSLPGLVKNQSGFASIINLYFPHQNAGKKIAEALIKKTQFAYYQTPRLIK